jgi:pimeloyl-ACP methyl ester carboxylesterase
MTVDNANEPHQSGAATRANERIHRAVSADGTEIAGRVQGLGPPLILVHGGYGDGAIAWKALLPYLTDRYTCYLPSTRGRGLSSDNPDHSPPRLQEDVTAFVDSIGEPVCLVGWSGSGAWVLGAAAHSDSVAAVTIYEPGVIGVGGEDDIARFGAAMQQVGAAAADGRLLEAAHAFLPGSAPTTRSPPWQRHPSTSNGQTASLRCCDSSSRTWRTRGLGRLTRKRSGRLPRRSCCCGASRPYSAPSSPTWNATWPSTSSTRTSESCRASVTLPHCSNPNPSPRN